MDVSIYDVIRGPRVTEKAFNLNKASNKLVLEVHPHANKPMIAEALKKLFNVDVEKIGIVVSKGKTRRVGRFVTQGKTKKKAIVTLKKGQQIDIMGMQTAREAAPTHAPTEKAAKE